MYVSTALFARHFTRTKSDWQLVLIIAVLFLKLVSAVSFGYLLALWRINLLATMCIILDATGY